MKLTDMAIKNLRPTEKPYKRFDGGGLYLEVWPTGAKIWRIKYYFKKKEDKLTLKKKYPDLLIKEARFQLGKVKKLLDMGLDPKLFLDYDLEIPPALRGLNLAVLISEGADIKMLLQQVRTSDGIPILPGGHTFEAVGREWIEKQRPSWKDSYYKESLERLERLAFPKIGSDDVKTILPRIILEKILRPPEAQKKYEMASRMLSLCNRIFKYAVVCTYCETNPCRDLEGALTPHEATPLPAITDPKEIAGLMSAIDVYPGSMVVRMALKWSAYTFLRPHAIRFATWDEILWDEKEWRIPRAKMKMKREHRVPLSVQCMEILKLLQEEFGSQKWIFPSQWRNSDRPLSETTVLAAIRRMGYDSDEMCAHGFRSIASTRLHEMGYPSEIIELQMAHKDRDQIRAIYNRAVYWPQRQKMMQEWADYLDELARNHFRPGILGGKV